jgi:hypothetical protein
LKKLFLPVTAACVSLAAAREMPAARDLVLTDPAVVHKIFTAAIQKLSVFYEGCIEKPKTKQE